MSSCRASAEEIQLETPLLPVLVTAALLGAGHTLLGPDHYVPFVAMARARGWTRRKTFAITAGCGAGHLIASLGLGALGVTAGLALSDIERFQTGRGNLAGWLLIGFGLAYLAWGIKRAITRRPHTHWHSHGDGTLHRHRHIHAGRHLHAHTGHPAEAHAHSSSRPTRTVTPWVLFIIFLFGPCEPLIPLLMVPAAAGNWLHLGLVAGSFSAATLTAMLSAVAIGLAGTERLRFSALERYSDALAGAAVTACGLMVHYGF